MTLWTVIRHALVYGVVPSAVLSVLLLGLLWMNRCVPKIRHL
jgi:hypothetical protein